MALTKIALIRGACVALMLSCIGLRAFAQAGSVYDRNQVQIWGTVLEGTVLQVQTRQVQSSWQARGVGASVGSALGFALARQHSNNSAAAALGTTLGGLAGERIANQVSQDEAQEIVLRLARPHNGMEIITVVQPAPFSAVTPGDQVLIAQSAGKTRVIKRTF